MLLLETLCSKLKDHYETSEPLIWVNDEPLEEDLDHILQQVREDSPFDPLELRQQTLDDLKSKKARLITKRCAYAKVLAIIYPTSQPDFPDQRVSSDQMVSSDQRVPWDLFAKIFQAFGKPRSSSWRLVWFANPTKRLFPPIGTPITAANVNGGYAKRCLPDTIVIYREEEVARVLVHELLHAACTDNMEESVEVIEAKTETWAELFLVAILAKASLRKAASFWRIQAQWIADQEYILTRNYGIQGPSDYAWRYTVARREVLKSLGIELPTPKPSKQSNLSLRFTSPSLCL